MNNSEWFPQARFGMMIHWGLYSLLAGEYEGERMGGADDGKRGELGEWAQSYFRIPCAKYEKLAEMRFSRHDIECLDKVDNR